MNIIEVSHLVKEYKKIKKESGLRGAVKNLFVQKSETVRAVDDISFSIEKGDIVGYIGPNGAGKSTTVKMLSGILQPTSGEILVGGVSPQKDRKRVVQNLGVVFGQRSQLNWDLRLGETFELLKRIYQIEDKTYTENLGMLNEIFQIDRFIDTPVRQLSLGQRMRGIWWRLCSTRRMFSFWTSLLSAWTWRRNILFGSSLRRSTSAARPPLS